MICGSALGSSLEILFSPSWAPQGPLASQETFIISLEERHVLFYLACLRAIRGRTVRF